MDKQIGMRPRQLEDLFAQFRANQQSEKASAQLRNEKIEEMIYNAYSPIVPAYAKKYNLTLDDAQYTFDEVFSFVFNNAVNKVIEGADFNACIRNIMMKKCQNQNVKPQPQNTEFTSNELLQQSFLYTMQVLVEFNKKPELADEVGLNVYVLKLLNDYYGINKENRRLNSEEIAEKYGLSPVSVRSRIAIALRKIRSWDTFNAVKQQNPDFNFGA